MLTPASRARIACVVATLCASTVASADVIVTNLAEPLRATTEIGNNPNPVPPPSTAPLWSWAAQSFTTDALSYGLTSISIIGGEAQAGPVIVAELRENNAGAIGALITTLNVGDFTGAPSARVLTPAAPVTLSASTTYWVVLGSQAPGDGTLGWSYAATNNAVGTGTIGQYADSQDSGVTWNYGSKFPYFIQVVGDKVTPCSGCVGDANGDNEVNFTDITTVLASFGTTCR